MADKEIGDYTQVAVPALTDSLAVQQSSVTYNVTVAGLFGTLSSLDAVTSLDGTETIFVRAAGVNNKVTLATLTDFILDNL